MLRCLILSMVCSLSQGHCSRSSSIIFKSLKKATARSSMLAANLKNLTLPGPRGTGAFIIFNYFSSQVNRFFFNTLSALLLVHLLGAQNGITGHPDWQIKAVYNRGFILVHRISIGHL